MSSNYKLKRENILLFFVSLFWLAYLSWLQFSLPVFYGVDSYYHISLSKFLKNFGPHYEFRWAQASTFKNAFADKDFFFHLILTPFTIFSDLVVGGKLAAIFLCSLFLLVVIFVLKKYLSCWLIALVLLLPCFSPIILYSLYLRPQILAILLTILGLYLIIEKKWLQLFLISFIYTLSHISFFTLLFFVIVIELIRFLKQKQMFSKNICSVFAGMGLAIILHPNGMGNYLLTIFLNAIVVPLFSFFGVDISFGNELYSSSTRDIFLGNIILFFLLGFVFFAALFSGKEAKLPTLSFFVAFSFYFLLSFMAVRFLYPANILGFIFCAFYLRDIGMDKIYTPRVVNLILIGGISILSFLRLPILKKGIENSIQRFGQRNTHYQIIGRWMNRNISAGKTIYHTFWSDSPYFICFNPKNNYLVVLDPIYMYYWDPKKYIIYQDLAKGKVSNPQILKDIFGTEYGYTNKRARLYYQIKDSPYFKILYEDSQGVVFRIIDYKDA
jgi:hypothetical protein